MTLLIDTREPWPHPWGRYLPTGWLIERGVLETGDIALAALPDAGVVERKTPGDLVSCIGTGRERFERELKRGPLLLSTFRQLAFAFGIIWGFNFVLVLTTPLCFLYVLGFALIWISMSKRRIIEINHNTWLAQHFLRQLPTTVSAMRSAGFQGTSLSVYHLVY